LGDEWYVTNGGGVVSLSVNANYKYFLIKPTDNYREMFNIEREIVVIFSDYVNFEPRSLDAIDHAQGKYNQLRIEKICAILISKDILLEQKVSELLKSDKEYQVIVPFTFDELLKPNPDAFFFRNRFKNHFYTRDIFAYQSALKKDIYFFGRNDLIHRIVNRHKSGDNSGLFGLRRTGKTSVIHGITRSLENSGNIAVVIDCQDTAFHKRKWNHNNEDAHLSLQKVIPKIIKELAGIKSAAASGLMWPVTAKKPATKL
jgi:predicted AAA+ superfamily ATPase